MLFVSNHRREHPLGELYQGAYVEYFSGEAAQLDAATRLALRPWGYRVFTVAHSLAR